MNPGLTLTTLLLLWSCSRILSLQEDLGPEGDPSEGLDVLDVSTRILLANQGIDNLEEGDMLPSYTRTAKKCWRNRCLWPKTSDGLVKVPYIISDTYNANDKAKIKGAMNVFHTKTCIRFTPRNDEQDFLSIEDKYGCWSKVGKYGYRQVLSLSVNYCLYSGVIQHELNHALGFYHEQNRSDRDQYVRINWENIQSDAAYNFKKRDTDNLGTPYDYSSLMHYSRMSYATHYSKETITPIPDPSVQIGQKYKLSDTDILRINKLYHCSE
ncbi:high choriolytic enzyme 1-like [Chanos chanos]|uniref:Metalloendopeptidase n=1 Tax=Chanos chanos TaxID=29144 RepID=A0A6J2WQ99_CHACN|nr:high choriolytic enzyme 1-like [Chanos chanos]